MMLHYALIGCRLGPACACGALTRDGAQTCAKCASRHRWSRRKARRGFGDG
jgi:hypothetical protein